MTNKRAETLTFDGTKYPGFEDFISRIFVEEQIRYTSKRMRMNPHLCKIQVKKDHLFHGYRRIDN